MNISTFNKMAFPKKSWSRSARSKSKKAVAPEDAIQDAVNEYLELKHLKYFRIPDSFFRWIKMNASPSIQKWFFWMFGGIPDNTVQIPIGDGLALTLLLELKTEDSQGRAVGQLHGRQRHHGEDWAICRNTREAVEAIDRFECLALRMREIVADHCPGCETDDIFLREMIFGCRKCGKVFKL